MSINLPYLEDTPEKLWQLLRHHKIRIFYNESTLHKLLCKLKDWVATENKNYTDYGTDCSNYEAVSISESKWPLKDCLGKKKKDLYGIAIMKIMKLQNDVGKQIPGLADIRSKLLIGKAG